MAVAGSIILHHFALWAGYRESEREGYKYVKGERPESHRLKKKGICVDPEQVKKEREARKTNSQSWLDTDQDPGHEDGASDANNAFTAMFTDTD